MSNLQDFRVNVIIETPVAQAVPIAFRKAFVFQSEDLTEGQLVLADDNIIEANFSVAQDYQEYLVGRSLNQEFYLLPYNDINNLQTILNDNLGKIGIIIYSMTDSETIIGGSVDYSFNEGIQFYSYVSDENITTNERAIEISKQNFKGIMYDPEKEGKLIYTILSLYKTYPIVSNQFNLRNDSFSSNIDTPLKSQAMFQDKQYAFSHYISTDQGIYLWDFYVGGIQGQAQSAYPVVNFEIKQSINNWIAEGHSYNDLELNDLKSVISTTLSLLQEQGVIEGFLPTTIKRTSLQTVSNRTRGIVAGFKNVFDFKLRIAKIEITIEGELN